jgi:hypothetical protein
MLPIRLQRLLFVMTVLVALTGCASGERVFTSAEKKNLHIATSLEPNSFGSVRATFLYVYEMDTRCKPNYLGYVRLEQPTIELGLPTGTLLVLTAEFMTRGRFSESEVRNAYEYLIQPQPGQEYFADIRHQNNLYKFSLTESRNGGAKRNVDRKGGEACISQGS